MKKLFLTLIITTVAYYTYAQNTFPVTGNAGIGTTNPTSGKLVIDNNISAPAIALHVTNTAVGNGNNAAIAFGGSGITAGSYGFIDYNPNSAAGVRYSALGPLVFGTNTNAGYNSSAFTETMRLTASGNLGIGDDNPAYKLSVNSQDNTSSASTLLHGKYYGTSISSEQTTASYYVLNVQGGTTSSGGSGNSLFYVRADGKVGIGTTSPDQKLTVNGTIHSTSVLVDTNVPVPDYVFKKDYNLPSLAEIKTYTDKNHHLPGIPAAAEVEKNGINVGEMNMMLLKKVEELTLYLIEKDKKETEQQEQINQLNKKVQALLIKSK